MKPDLLFGLMLIFAWLVSAVDGRCAENMNPPIADMGVVMSDSELSEQRAGFSWQGLDIQLGVQVRSYLGNEMVMETTLNWTDSAQISRTISAALTPASSISGDGAADGLALGSGQAMTYFANLGQTAFIQRVDGAIQNIITNRASNVDLRQEVDVQIDIARFAPFRDDVLGSRIATALSGMNGLAFMRSALSN